MTIRDWRYPKVNEPGASGRCSSAARSLTPPLAGFGHLIQVIRHGLKKVQYRPGLIEGCLAGTGLTLDQVKHPMDITN